MMVFSLWHPEEIRFAIDLFVEEPFDFEVAHERALKVSLPQTEATVIALEDLIRMKRGTGRAKDAEDVEALVRLDQLSGGAGGS